MKTRIKLLLRTFETNRRWWLTSAALVIASFSLATLQTYPPPSGDEATYASAAVSLLERGTPGRLVLGAGDPFNRDQNSNAFGRTYLLGMAATMRLGGVSHFTARLVSWLGWLVASLMVYLIGRRFYGRRVAIAAAFLFATSIKAFYTAHFTRPESWAAAAILCAIWATLALLEAEHSRKRVALLVGLLAVWPADLHANGLAFTLACGTLVAFELGPRRKQWSTLLAYAAGILAGIAMWIALHFGTQALILLSYLQRISSPLAQSSSGQTVSPWLKNLASYPQWFVTIFWSMGSPLALAEAALALLGVASALRHGPRYNRWLALIGCGALVFFGLITPLRYGQYGVLWSPLWFLLGASAMFRLAERARLRRTLGRAVPATLLALTVAHVAGSAWLAYSYRGGDYRATSQQLAELVPPGQRVIADTVWWWALRPERTFLADNYFSLLTRTDNASVQAFLGINEPLPDREALALTLDVLNADYVIVDGALHSQAPGSPLWVELLALVEQRCEPVGQVAGGWANDPAKGFSQLGQVSTVYAC